MRSISLAYMWTAIKALIGGLGGFAGIKMIYDFLTRGAKPKIFWIRDHMSDMYDLSKSKEPKDEALVGSLILVLIDVVNLRQHPVCIRNWDLEIHAKGKVFKASRWHIQNGLTIPAPSGNVDISKERLSEKSFNNPIEYGKAMRGWLGFQMLGKKQETFRLPGFYFVFIVEDAFGKKHRIKCTRPNVAKDSGVHYFEGSGQQITTTQTFHFDSTISPKPQT